MYNSKDRLKILGYAFFIFFSLTNFSFASKGKHTSSEIQYLSEVSENKQPDIFIPIDIKDQYFYYNEGISKYMEGDFKGAIDVFTKGLEIYQISSFFNNRGAAYLEIKNYKEAENDYRKALEIDPNDPDIYFNLANIKDLLGDLNGAIEFYDQLIEIDGNYKNAYYNKATNKFILGEYINAIKAYTKALQASPNDELIYYNRASAKYKIRDYKGSISDYTKAISINSKEYLSFSNRGSAKYEIGDYKGAIDDYRKSLFLKPNNPITYYNLSGAYFKLLNYKEACKSIRKSISLGLEVFEKEYMIFCKK